MNGFFRVLDNRHSTWGIAACLLPALLIFLMPTGFYPNEYNYFMLAFRRVSPESFSNFSAAFDASDARIAFELGLGYLIKWLGYHAAQMVLRLAMAATYAAAIGYLLSVLKLSALDGLIVLSVFVVSGEDILGKEWLFQGVESKTFAYALVMIGLACAVEGRLTRATWAAATATYVHFLVGGFWLIALLAYDAVRDFSPRRLARALGLYVALVGPLLLLIAYEQLGASGVGSDGLTANVIYASRAPHHIAPFLDRAQFRIWMPDIAFLFALSAAFLYLLRTEQAKSRPLVRWVTVLLCYLIAALVLSALDAKTAYLGKFYLFRPSSLILFCAIVAFVGLFNDLENKTGIKQRIRQVAFLLLIPVAAMQAIEARLVDLSHTRRAMFQDIARMNAFIVNTTGPDDIILVQPGGEYVFPMGAMPMLIDRPTLVSYKFIPTNNLDLFRWYDLLQYRDRVFDESCKDIGRYPVRYLLMTQRPEMKTPCGKVVWQSDNFALVAP